MKTLKILSIVEKGWGIQKQSEETNMGMKEDNIGKEIVTHKLLPYPPLKKKNLKEG